MDPSTEPQVQVALATYNGEQYLDDLLNSIQIQSFRNWSLQISDDNSDDNTFKLLQAFAKKSHNPVQITSNNDKKGVIGNFAQVLDMCDGSYVMLCDQDDVWLSEKIQNTLGVMLDTERRFGIHMPILVHTDLKPVNNKLEPLSESFWTYQHLVPERAYSLKLNLVQNMVTGCTVMVNRALLERALPIPKSAIMHDWWLTLVASAFGKVMHLSQPTILYRQHGKNEIGAKHWGFAVISERAKDTAKLEDSIRRKLQQAQIFLERYNQDLSKAQRSEVEAFASLRERGSFERRVLIAQHGFWFHGLLRNLGWLIRI